MILVGYLLSAGLATQLVLHPESIPWFVSDVIPADFAALLNALANLQAFYSSPSDDDKHKEKRRQRLEVNEEADIKYLFQHRSTLHQNGQLMILQNRFWTHGGSYWHLPHTEKDFFEDFRDSELVIFKGDLNYRKLTGDIM